MANYRIAELEFDDIKQNLKTFLSNYRDKEGNLLFSDFDFESSSISVLLDILSYNTHYNAYLANMVANEMFLDSAVKRESVVSLAKQLGYTPISYRSSRASISFTANTPEDLPATLTLPKYTPFTTPIGGTLYTFVNLDAVTISPENGVYRFENVELVQGEPLVYTFRVDQGGPSEKYTIPNLNVDTSTLRVRVQESYTNLEFSTYTYATNLTNLNTESKVFFLEESTKGYYEIFFGDGSLGKKLVDGNLVIVEYLISAGSETNVSSKIQQAFTLAGEIPGSGLDAPVVATINSTGGDSPDTIDEIKFKAPKFLSSYDRAVTAADYKAIIEANYPLIESVTVWGGEDNDPPVYGKVMISLKPYQGYTVNDTVKNAIVQSLQSKKMLGVTPEFVDPQYLFVQINTDVRYNQKNSRFSPKEIELLVRQKIQDYFVVELQKFDLDFVYSKLSKYIDSADSSIIGSTNTFKLQKRIEPELNALNGYTGATAIKFTNELVSGTIKSTTFYYRNSDTGQVKLVYLRDTLTEDDSSVLNLYDSTNDELFISNIGTVNYLTGELEMRVFSPIGFLENSADIRIYGTPKKLDLYASRDVILVIDDSQLYSLLKRESGLKINVLTQ